MRTPAESYEVIFYQESLVWVRNVAHVRKLIQVVLDHIKLQRDREEITEEQRSYLHLILYERFKPQADDGGDSC
jgi:hypothetical protein